MQTIFNFFVLDALSMKSELQLKNLFPYVLLFVVGYISMGIYGFVVAFVPFMMTVSYPFAAGYNGLDKLYNALAIPRKTVVAGRYLFAVLLCFIITGLYIIIGFIVAAVMGDDVSGINYVSLLGAAFLLSSAVIAIGFPILFKQGFQQAKSLILKLPLLLVGGLMILMHSVLGGPENFIKTLEELTGGFSDYSRLALFILTGAAFWLFMMVVSYRFSLKIYKARSF